MTEALTAATRQRGTICASITKFEAQIVQWERKAALASSDHHAIQRSVETMEEYDADLKTNHFAVVPLANEEELEAEQVILDNHTHRARKFSDFLLQLLPELEKVSEESPATTVAEGLLKRLRYVIH